MPIRYKFDVLSALKNAGYSTYRLQKDKILSSSTIQKLRKGVIVDIHNIAVLCRLLSCNVGDLLEYVEEPTE